MQTAARKTPGETLPKPALPRPVAILVNPDSFRVSVHGRLDRVQALARSRRLQLRLAHGPDSVGRALEEIDPGPSGTVAVIGGDGTLHAVVSQLARSHRPDELPAILMLGGGRTNFSAHDLGTGRRLIRTLEKALTADSVSEQRRRVLRVEHPGLQSALSGFFLAGALIDHVIRDVHRFRTAGRGPLRHGHVSTAWRVLQLGLRGLAGNSGFSPPALEVVAADLGRIKGPARLLLASTLEHETRMLDPYAKRGEGTLRVTVATATARGFWRRVPRLARGRYHPAMSPEHGYLSGRTQRIEIRGLASFCLDGQEYSLAPDQQLLISPGPEFRFLQP